MKAQTLIKHLNEILRDYQKHIGWDNAKLETTEEIKRRVRGYEKSEIGERLYQKMARQLMLAVHQGLMTGLNDAMDFIRQLVGEVRKPKVDVEDIADSVQFDLYDETFCRIDIKELTTSLKKHLKEAGVEVVKE